MPSVNNQSNAAMEKVSGKSRWWFSFVLLLVPIIFFLLLELFLRAVGYEKELHEFVLVRQFQGQKYYQINPLISQRYFASHNVSVPEPYPELFRVQKQPGTIRVFCIGESTMYGYPYPENINAPRFLRQRLEAMYPQRKFEIINLGIPAISSTVIVDLVKNVLNYEPDLLIVYSGHNEFYGTYGVASTEYLGQNRAFLHFYMWLRNLRTFELVRNVVLWVENLFAPKEKATRRATFLERMVRDREIPMGSNLYLLARKMYAGNINEMIDLAKARGVPIAFTTVASNEKDLPPFISVFSPGAPDSVQAKWEKLYLAGVQLLNAHRVEEALQKFTEAINLDTMRADAHYRRAQCLWSLNRFDEARGEFIRARDLDALRFRASSEFNDLLRAICMERGVPIVDLDSIYSANSPHGIIGSNLIIEHLHPNLLGYFLMGKAYASLVIQLEKDQLRSDVAQTLPPDDTFLSMAPFTALDTVSANIRVHILRSAWPFKENPSGTFTYEPKTTVEQIAFQFCEEALSWEGAHYTMANEEIKEGNIAAAAKEYETVAKELYLYYHPLMLLGDMQVLMKDYNKAEQLYLRALTLQNVQFVHLRLGVLYAQQGKNADAIHHLQEALSIDQIARVKMTTDVRLMTMYTLGIVYNKIGEKELARKEMEQILAINPNHRAALAFLQHLASERQ